jgi:hypothetical protein
MRSTALADDQVAGEASIKLALNINPTTIRALVVRRNTDPLEGLTLRRFFNPPASTQEAFAEGTFADPTEIALDGAENVLLSVTELGGRSAASRATERNRFLSIFETKLRALAQAMVEPRTCDWEPREEFLATLDWGRLLLQQAELYFERKADDPVALVYRLHDRALGLARRIKGQKFWDVPPGGKPIPTTFAVEQDDGYPHMVLPLTGTRNVELSIYAKTNLRVRFEVRYKRKFGHHLRGCSTSDDRLASLLLRLLENAAERLPWPALKRAAAIPPFVDVGDIPDLIHRLVTATARQPDLFQPIVRQIIMTAGVIADEERFPGISKAVRRLEREGVLIRWAIQQKEERKNRKYGLSDRYSAIRLKMLSGFAPVEQSALETPDPAYPPDHYEENALLMGGPQWVERPYNR